MKKNTSIKGIFFDAGDTLFEAKEAIGFYYSQTAARYGVKIEVETLDKRFKNAFKKAPPLAFPDADKETLSQLEYAWWYTLVRDVFLKIDFPRFDAFFEELYGFFASEAPWRLFPETQSVLASLKKSGFTLGIISNFDSRLIPICRHLGIYDYFDPIVFSSQNSVAKPHPAIFEKTLKTSGLMPSESLYIGDHYQNDVVGPESVGMSALLIERGAHASEADQAECIRDLREIGVFLDKPL
ncbi:MAG: HAD-IA family hydrolase [Nitrospirae bacterium]|nr:HAD-IA family hydrolase [Candidatus Manganitrophaceae bacterium]